MASLFCFASWIAEATNHRIGGRNSSANGKGGSTYPIAYNKWIREQILEILNLSELYLQLPPIVAVGDIESDECKVKAEMLGGLLELFCLG